MPWNDSTHEVADEPSTHAPAVTAYLLVFEGASSATVHVPLDGDVVIGRGERAEVRLLDGSVSRAHARLTMIGGEAELVDLGSQNGTKVNGERIVGGRPLLSGDVVTILGATLVFHASSRARPRRALLALDRFRQRVEDETDRIARSRRGFGLAVIALARPDASPRVFDPIALAQVIDPALRRIDVAALGGAELRVLLPELDVTAARALVRGLLERLAAVAPDARGGVAVAPGDGNDFEILLIGARAACDRAAAGGVELASETFRTIRIEDRDLVVADPAMLRVMALLERLARTGLSVLVCGETGTGKELAATVLHRWSPRAAGPLVVLNCAAIPEALVESELFGHEKGAFTGAVAQKLGLLERGDGGTVLLDEIGELSPATQAKLLRALETRRITRVGGHGEHLIDLRIVAATNRDLAEEVKAGRFRQDLLFRLCGATVWLPPLRDRRREIPILAHHFLAEVCRHAGREMRTIAADAMQRLLDYAWPGNVRELRHVMEYLAAAHDEPTVEAWHVVDRTAPPFGGAAGRGQAPTVDRTAPPFGGAAGRGQAPTVDRLGGERHPNRDATAPVVPDPMPPGDFTPIEDEIRELERTRMGQALAATSGNQTVAAELLKMPLRTFQAKAKVYGLRAKDRG